MTNTNPPKIEVEESIAQFKNLHRLDGECAECGGTGEGADNPCSDRGETYPCYVCNGKGTWSVYRQKDVDKFVTTIHQQGVLSERERIATEIDKLAEKYEDKVDCEWHHFYGETLTITRPDTH